MDENKAKIIEMRLEKTKKALINNNMNAIVVDSKEQALKKIRSMILEGDIIGAGGSRTLDEIGLIDYLNEHPREFDFIGRRRSEEELFSLNKREIQRQSLLSDIFFCSSNAITENGELFNIDGNGNRVAALAFGPKSVVVVAGYNKIVKDIDEAYQRVRRISAPANALRLGLETPCSVAGECQDCRSDCKICCSALIQGWQRNKNRITVILVKEELGF